MGIALEFTPATIIFVVTILLSCIGLFVRPKLIERSLFRPYWFRRQREYDTLLLSGFMHADVPHLLFNMMTFYFFAFTLESRIGPGAFLTLYVLGLTLSELGTYYKHRNDQNYATLGASGAIAAVLFAFIVFYPENRLIVFPLPIPIPAPLFAILYLAFTYYSSRQAQGRINHDAHFGGALTGLLFVAFYEPSAYRNLLGFLS